jgi:Putative beta-barrel porin-2, OmpL-like. bbp2
MARWWKALGWVVMLSAVSPAAVHADKSVADILGKSAALEGEPRSYLEELMLYGYIENSYVANLRDAGRGGVNELRFYDHAGGYTFNAVELSVKKDPSERYRLGYGVVITAGIDSQKNHSLGIFRDLDDGPPLYRNTEKFDLPEAYASYLIPLGSGLTIKAGKWATLIGYEVYESPKNLNFSRSFLYTLGTPYTNTGALASYQFTQWFGATLGLTMGWDNSDNNNGYQANRKAFSLQNHGLTPTSRAQDTISFDLYYLFF